MEETILDRLRTVLRETGNSQTKLGELLHVTPQYIWKIMNKDCEPSERLILAVAKEFGVNEEWLRNGTGEPHPPKTRGAEIGEIAASAVKSDPEAARKLFTGIFEDLTDGEILLMAEIFNRHFQKKEKD